MKKYYQPSGQKLLWRCKKFGSTLLSFFRKNFLSSIFFLSIFIILLGTVVAGYILFTSPNFTIVQVNVVMDENASQYKNRMEHYLQRDFVGTNILSSLRYRFKFLGYYKNKYEWISHIDSTREKNILTINIKGKVPDLYYSIGGVKYAQIIDKGNAVYQLTGGFDILSGSIPVLDMLTSSKLVETGFSVMFQGLSAEALVRQIQIIHNSIAIYRSMQYIPGGQKLILSNKQGGHFYFDLRKNMYEQLAKYRMINGTGVLIRGDVDLGTMDDLIFY